MLGEYNLARDFFVVVRGFSPPYHHGIFIGVKKLNSVFKHFGEQFWMFVYVVNDIQK